MDSDPGTSGYSPSEIDSIRCEIEANNERASLAAAERGYKRNPRALKLA